MRLRAGSASAFGVVGIVALRLNSIRIWISSVIGNRLVPARDFFLEKKQKRARCSGLPSRFILCRTCRAKAACLGGVSVCIPRAAARHTLRVLCGILEPGSGPAHARIKGERLQGRALYGGDFCFRAGGLRGKPLKLIPALRACVSNMLRLMQVLPL